MFEEHHGEKAVLKPYYIAGITNNKSTQNWCAQQGRLSIIGAKKFTLIRNQFYCNKFINGWFYIYSRYVYSIIYIYIIWQY